jgi:hypothetical protein
MVHLHRVKLVEVGGHLFDAALGGTDTLWEVVMDSANSYQNVSTTG